MRLAVNGYFLGLPFTGTGQYTRHLLKELAGLWDGDVLVYYPRTKRLDSLDPLGDDSFASSDLESRPGRLTFRPVTMPLRGNLGKVWFEQVALPFALRGDRPQVLHVPYFGPPLLPPCPTVVTIHDLIPIAFPQPELSPLAKLYSSLAVMGVKKASAIIADSRHAKDDVLAHLKTEPEAVKVIYLAADDRYHPGIPEGVTTAVKEKHGLIGEYILYLGGLDTRKNVSTLIRAFAQLEDPWQLAIAGEPLSDKRANFPDVKGLAGNLGVSERVKFLGMVSEADKPALYSGASLFVYPSLYEGFGLPPLEAMACGTPVLASNSSSIPEVVGDAALLFDPLDVEGLSRLMAQAQNDSSLRLDLAEKGLCRASLFSWRKTAEKTLQVYLSAMEHRTSAEARVGRSGGLR